MAHWFLCWRWFPRRGKGWLNEFWKLRCHSMRIGTLPHSHISFTRGVPKTTATIKQNTTPRNQHPPQSIPLQHVRVDLQLARCVRYMFQLAQRKLPPVGSIWVENWELGLCGLGNAGLNWVCGALEVQLGLWHNRSLSYVRVHGGH